MHFQIGQKVRLCRGWTKMTVIGYDGDEIIASYLSEIGPADYDRPLEAYSTQVRHHSGFVAWDGKANQRQLEQKMPVAPSLMNPKFRVSHPHYTGMTFTKVGVKRSGLVMLEDVHGKTHEINGAYIHEIKPVTFLARAVSKSHTCHYILADGQSVAVDDILMSKSGNMYVVKQVDTKSQNPKKVFEGTRLVREAL